ncbi:MAG: iron-containing alcohol dehydrogenase [Duodenibacillus sp.]|nr:iron-containing alcohol dehydrogenase [Duodenibacillus sp.]
MTNNFCWHTPTRVLFGKGQIENLPEECARYGRRVLLAYGGGSIKRIGLYDKVKALLSGFEVWELAGIEPNPRVTSAREGARLCKEHGIDLILSVGGGSVLDCCKLIAGAAHYDGDAWDLVLDSSKTGECTPIIDVMTLAATGSELDCGAVITSFDNGGHYKMAYIHPGLWPKVSILDPSYTTTVNAWHTASGASDILSHVFEQYFVGSSCMVTDGFCEAVMRTVVQMTPVALREPDNYEARAALMWASSWGCNGLLELGNDPSRWICHALEHEISAFYDVTHGAGLAVVTPRWLRHSLTESTAPRIAEFGRRVFELAPSGDARADALRAIEALEAFYKAIGMPASMQELGVEDRSHIEDIVGHAMQRYQFDKAFKPLSRDEVVAIIEDCYA